MCCRGVRVHLIDVTFGLHCFAPGFAFRRVLGLGLVLFGVGCERVRACYLRLVGGGWVI